MCACLRVKCQQHMHAALGQVLLADDTWGLGERVRGGLGGCGGCWGGLSFGLTCWSIGKRSDHMHDSCTNNT